MAAIFAVGALIIVLIFALAMDVQRKRDNKEANAKDTNGGTIELNANPKDFVAKTLPDAGLVAMDGQVVSLADLTDGKPAMINFFSRACTACRTEMPALEKLHQQAGDKFRMVGVNLGDSPDVTSQFVKDMGVTYAIARDPNLLMVNRLRISAQPLTIWADASGNITGHRYGGMSGAEMRKELQRNLNISLPAS